MLITGINGQLGIELLRALDSIGEIIAVDRARCDLSNPRDIRALVRSIRPDIIINPAAYTAVDKAESDREMAYAVNACAPGVLGEEAASIGACVVHYSTDYVFNGLSHGPYNENDKPDPQNVYGQSKWSGEQALQQSGAPYLILRTSWVVGAHGGNFAKTILRLAAERENLNVVADQFGAPTSATLIADVTVQLVRQIMRDGNTQFPFGLYHLAASGVTSWHEYAQFVVAEVLNMGKQLKTAPKNIKAISAAEYPLPAKRPANSLLDTQKIRNTFGLILPDWRDGVRQVLQQIY